MPKTREVERSVHAPSRWPLAAAFGAFVFSVALWTGVGGLLRVPLDFTAFRCAGLIVARGGDPYRVEPLRRCENTALAVVGRSLPPHLVVPAPLPPYALLPFGALGPLPTPLPSTIWACVLFAAFLGTLALLRPLLRGPFAVAVATLLFADLVASLLIGQTMPIELTFLALIGYALYRGEHLAASIGAALSMLQPQIGLPVVVAVALWDQRTRWPLAVAMALILVFSLCPGGIDLNLEYLQRVLPAQARAEGLDSAVQFSLSAQLAAVGWSPSDALWAGLISYIFFSAAGVAIGRALAQRFAMPAFVVFAPAAFALIGGLYAHIHQMCAALLLGLLLIGRVKRWRTLLACGIFLLGMPWQTIAELTLYHPFPNERMAAVEHLMDQVDDDDALAAGVWGVWVTNGAHNTHSPQFTFTEKLPTWIGLLLVAFVALSAAYARETRTADVPIGETFAGRPEARAG